MSSKRLTACPPVVRWTTSLAGLPALSVHQPWAWLIVNGLKDIENRSRRTQHRGPLLIHAGRSLDDYTEDNIEWVKRKHGISVPLEMDTGGIVGVVDVIDCVESHKSKWFNGPFGWVLANPRRLKFRPCNGALGLFRGFSSMIEISEIKKRVTISKGHGGGPQGSHKKPVSAAGYWVKLKEAYLKKVLRLRKKGLTYRAIAKQLGDIVTYQQIHKIVSGQSRILENRMTLPYFPRIRSRSPSGKFQQVNQSELQAR